MPITPYSSSDLTRSRNNRQIYSGYRINIQANQLGIPAIPTAIKGPSRDIVQALREGPTNFTPAELTAILNNNSGSTAAPGPPPIIFSSAISFGPPIPGGYLILPGYTSMNYVLIGGGGGGFGDGSGMGGGSGGFASGTIAISEGQLISITVGEGGGVGSGGVVGYPGETTTLYFNNQSTTVVTGGQQGQAAAGGSGGIPGGVSADNSSGEGGVLSSEAFAAYGRGGNGDTSTGGADDGTDGFYRITLT